VSRPFCPGLREGLTKVVHNGLLCAETIVNYGPITEEQFLKALDRLGERDVLKLVRGGAFDGDEALWSAKWLRGERPATAALALAHDSLPAEPAARPFFFSPAVTRAA
jgi:hypothetical protein